MNHLNGFTVDITCTSANTVTILGYGASNKLLEATYLTFTGNSSTNRTTASTVKRYVMHFNGISNGGSATVTITYNGGTQVVVTAAPDAIAIFDVT